MMKSRDMTVGSPSKNILMFAVPVLLGNLFQQFYSLTDRRHRTYLLLYPMGAKTQSDPQLKS